MPNALIGSRPSPGFALNALPDEHFYSVLARHMRLGAYPSAEAMLSHIGIVPGPLKSEDMFNGPARLTVPFLAESLSRPVADFAEQHTLWPIVRIAMVAEVAAEWLEYWQSGDAPPQSTVRPMNDRLLHHDRQWRYCPACLGEDRAHHGVAYWHVTHQIPALTSCPRHECSLIGACPNCAASLMNLRGLELPPLCECAVPAAPPRYPHWDAWLSSRFERLRSGESQTVENSLQEIRQGFGLPERITGRHRDRIDRLLGEVETVVGQGLLGEIFEWYQKSGDKFRGRQQPNLLRTTLRENTRRRVRHPLYYLILVYALEMGISRDEPSIRHDPSVSASHAGDALRSFSR